MGNGHTRLVVPTAQLSDDANDLADSGYASTAASQRHLRPPPPQPRPLAGVSYPTSVGGGGSSTGSYTRAGRGGGGAGGGLSQSVPSRHLVGGSDGGAASVGYASSNALFAAHPPPPPPPLLESASASMPNRPPPPRAGVLSASSGLEDSGLAGSSSQESTVELMDFIKGETSSQPGELECIASGFLSLTDYLFIAATLRALSALVLAPPGGGGGGGVASSPGAAAAGRSENYAADWKALRAQVLNFHVGSGGDGESTASASPGNAPLFVLSPHTPSVGSASESPSGTPSVSPRRQRPHHPSAVALGLSMDELQSIAEKDEALALLMRAAGRRLPRVKEMLRVMPASAALEVHRETGGGIAELLNAAFGTGADVAAGIDKLASSTAALTVRYMERFVSGLPVWINSRLSHSYTSPSVPIISSFLTCGVHTSRRKEFFVSLEERVALLRESQNPFHSPEEILLCIGQMSSYVSNMCSGFSLFSLLAIAAETSRIDAREERRMARAAAKAAAAKAAATNELSGSAGTSLRLSSDALFGTTLNDDDGDDDDDNDNDNDAADGTASPYAPLRQYAIDLCKKYSTVNNKQFESVRRRYPNAFALSTLLCDDIDDDGPLPVLGVAVSLLLKLVFLFAGGINSISADDRRTPAEQLAHAQDGTARRRDPFERLLSASRVSTAGGAGAAVVGGDPTSFTEDVAMATALQVKALSRLTHIARCMHLESANTGFIPTEDALICADIWRTLFQYAGALPAGDACPRSMLEWIKMFPLYAVDNEAKCDLLFVHSLLANQCLLSLGPVMRENVLQCTSVLLHRSIEAGAVSAVPKPEPGADASRLQSSSVNNNNNNSTINSSSAESEPSCVLFPTFATRRWGLEGGEGHGPRKDLFEGCAVESWSPFLPSINISAQIDLGVHKGDVGNLSSDFPPDSAAACAEELRAYQQRLIVLVSWKEAVSVFTRINAGDELTLCLDVKGDGTATGSGSAGLVVAQRKNSLVAEVETAVQERLQQQQARAAAAAGGKGVSPPGVTGLSPAALVAHPPAVFGNRAAASPRFSAASGLRSGGSNDPLNSPPHAAGGSPGHSPGSPHSPLGSEDVELLAFAPTSSLGEGGDGGGDCTAVPAMTLTPGQRDAFEMSRLGASQRPEGEDYLLPHYTEDMEGTLRTVVLAVLPTRSAQQQIVVLNQARSFDKSVTAVFHHRRAAPAFTLARGAAFAWTNPQFKSGLEPLLPSSEIDFGPGESLLEGSDSPPPPPSAAAADASATANALLAVNSGVPFTLGWLLGNSIANGIVFQAPIAPLAFRLLSKVVKFEEPVEEIELNAADLTLVCPQLTEGILRSAMAAPDAFLEMYGGVPLDQLPAQDVVPMLRDVIRRVAAEQLWNVEGDEWRSRAFWAEVVRGLRSTVLAATPLFTNCCARTLRTVLCGRVDSHNRDFHFKSQFLIVFDWGGTHPCYRETLHRLTLDAFDDGWSVADKRLLLRFITGRSLLPRRAKSEFIHVVFTSPASSLRPGRVPAELRRLPTSHSCDNQLELPNYLEYLLLTLKAPELLVDAPDDGASSSGGGSRSSRAGESHSPASPPSLLAKQKGGGSSPLASRPVMVGNTSPVLRPRGSPTSPAAAASSSAHIASALIQELWESLTEEEAQKLETQFAAVLAARLRTAATESDTFEEEPGWMAAAQLTRSRRATAAAAAVRRFSSSVTQLRQSGADLNDSLLPDDSEESQLFANFRGFAHADASRSSDNPFGIRRAPERTADSRHFFSSSGLFRSGDARKASNSVGADDETRVLGDSVANLARSSLRPPAAPTGSSAGAKPPLTVFVAPSSAGAAATGAAASGASDSTPPFGAPAAGSGGRSSPTKEKKKGGGGGDGDSPRIHTAASFMFASGGLQRSPTPATAVAAPAAPAADESVNIGDGATPPAARALKLPQPAARRSVAGAGTLSAAAATAGRRLSSSGTGTAAAAAATTTPASGSGNHHANARRSLVGRDGRRSSQPFGVGGAGGGVTPPPGDRMSLGALVNVLDTTTAAAAAAGTPAQRRTSSGAASAASISASGAPPLINPYSYEYITGAGSPQGRSSSNNNNNNNNNSLFSPVVNVNSASSNTAAYQAYDYQYHSPVFVSGDGSGSELPSTGERHRAATANHSGGAASNNSNINSNNSNHSQRSAGASQMDIDRITRELYGSRANLGGSGDDGDGGDEIPNGGDSSSIPTKKYSPRNVSGATYGFTSNNTTTNNNNSNGAGGRIVIRPTLPPAGGPSSGRQGPSAGANSAGGSSRSPRQPNGTINLQNVNGMTFKKK